MLARESTAAMIPPLNKNDIVVVPCAMSMGGVGEMLDSKNEPSSI